jgi:hypothetical protein
MSLINGIPCVRKMYENGESEKKIEKNLKKRFGEGSTTIDGRQHRQGGGIRNFLVLPYNQMCVY